MTRLCEDIQTLRADRQELNKKLAEGTKARQVEILETCAAYNNARVWKAEGARNSRQSFVDNLKQVVAGQVKDTRDDLAMARRSWANHGKYDGPGGAEPLSAVRPGKSRKMRVHPSEGMKLERSSNHRASPGLHSISHRPVHHR
jgi:hypothetical protein